jgi:hypothetical protein
MSRKQWYILEYNFDKGYRRRIVHYTQNKKEAEKLVKNFHSDSYIDFQWKEDVKNIPFSRLHGKGIIKAS